MQPWHHLSTTSAGRARHPTIPRDHVSILLRESEAQNWGIRGGQAASDVDLGFTVTV
jgi:hypothetical protein